MLQWAWYKALKIYTAYAIGHIQALYNLIVRKCNDNKDIHSFISVPLITHSGNSHLVEFELKAQDVAKSEWLTHVGLDERQEELILVRSTLVHLQDDVQNTIRVQVETSCRQKK